MVAIVGKAVPPQRKRVIDAMHLREPDRVPIGLWGTYEGYRNLRKGLGMEYNDELFNYRTGSTTWTTDVAFELDLAEKLDLDFVRISLGPPGGSPGFRTIGFEEVPFDMGIPPPSIPINVDEWGVVRKWTPHERGGYYEMIGYPLFHATSAPLEEGLRELEAFPWPDPRDLLMMTDSPIPGMSLRDYCKYVHEETPFALMAQAGKGGLFEQAKYLVGYAKIFSDFIEAPKFLDALLIKLVDLEIEFNKTMIDEIGEYIDWIRVSPEDLASEKTSFVSLKMFQKQLIPHYHRAHIATKEMFLKKNPLGKIQFHSCGAVPLSFLKAMTSGKTKDGIQAVDGFDSMPPKVARHSGPRSKKLMIGEKMFFYGGIDVQETLPWGTPEQVRREVRLRIWELGKGGGYIVSSSHRLEHDVPVANTLAMIEETKEYGKYPLPEQPPDGADVGDGLQEIQR